MQQERGLLLTCSLGTGGGSQCAHSATDRPQLVSLEHPHLQSFAWPLEKRNSTTLNMAIT